MIRLATAEDLSTRLLTDGSRRGSTWFGRMGDIVQQPPLWAGLAAVLGLSGGLQGRRAALRGSVYYATAAVVGNVVIKPVVRRSRPPDAGRNRAGPATSSFPSGHAATDLAFVLGASQELPALFLPLSIATLAAHWSLVRSRGHYPSDVIVGGLLAFAVALTMSKLWPSRRCEPDPTAPPDRHSA